MDNAPTIPTRKRRRLLFLVGFLAIPAFILFSILALERLGRCVDKRPSANVAIDIAIAHLRDAPSLASSILAGSARSIVDEIPTTEPGHSVGLISNRDGRRTLIMYYTQQQGDDYPVVHSAELFDHTSRTAKWLMLDRARMSEYLAAASSTSMHPTPK